MIDTQKLKALIVERGKTQKDIAREIGVSDNAFYLWMKNPERIKIEDAMKISKALEIDDIFQFFNIFFADWKL